MNKKIHGFMTLLLLTVPWVGSGSAVEAQQAHETHSASHFGRGIAGLYDGELDFAPLGNTRIEPLTMLLTLGREAIMTSEHEPTEIESATLGLWSRARRGWIEIGIQAHRLGDGACAIIAPPQGSAGDDCLLGLYAVVRRVEPGVLEGTMDLIFWETDAASGELVAVRTPPLPLRLTRKTMDDFRP